MKISVDAGALCSKNQFGNFIVTKNLIEAISLYDHKNEYYLYSFCGKPRWLKPGGNIYYQEMYPKKFWLNGRVTIEELINPKNVFLAINQAIPFYTPAKVISFSHGLSFHFFPQYYPDSYLCLKQQLETMIKKSAYIIVSSQKVKEELILMHPPAGRAGRCIDNIVVLPFGIPFDMAKGKTGQKRDKFFLSVGMNHQIKNINFIVRAYNEFIKDKRFKDFKLKIINHGQRSYLKKLYRQATAYLTASYYESFNFPVLEAFSQNCPVVGLKSAIIPEFKNYVHLAHNLSEFVCGMKAAAEGARLKIDLKKLRQEFSWKNYIKKLVELYD